MEFRNLRLTASSELGETSDGAGSKVSILKGLCGKVGPGETLAIMGPSGSGKTTLLRMLAGQVTPNAEKFPEHSGTISVFCNGTSWKELAATSYPFSEEVKLVSLVEQEDFFENQVTVGEQLEFHAKMRLFRLSKAEQQEKITTVLHRLRLSHCRDRRIGFLSGGERKRLSIAEELLHEKVSVLLLDEPTSGLDSTMAREVVDILYDDGLEEQQGASSSHSSAMNSQNAKTTILFTIHQPSSLIYSRFREVYFIGKGECCYFGPGLSMAHELSDKGFAFPRGYNAAEFALDLIQNEEKREKLLLTYRELSGSNVALRDSAEEVRRDEDTVVATNAADRSGPMEGEPPVGEHQNPKQISKRILSKYAEMLPPPDLDTVVAHDEALNQAAGATTAQDVVHATASTTTTRVVLSNQQDRPSWWTQVRALHQRTYRARLRRRFETWLALYANGALLALCGWIFFRTPPHPKMNNTRHGAAFFFFVHPNFSAAFETMTMLVQGARFLRREIVTKRLYSLSAFSVGRMTGELPISSLFPLLFTIAACFLVQFHGIFGVDDDVTAGFFFEKFFVFLLISECVMLTANAAGAFVASLTDDPDIATAILLMILLPMLLLNGFMLDLDLLPVWMRWVKYLSLAYWGFNAMIVWAWTDVKLDTCSTEEFVLYPDDCQYKTGEEVLKSNFGIDVTETDHIANSLVALLAFAAICRVLAFGRNYSRYMCDDSVSVLLEKLKWKKSGTNTNPTERLQNTDEK
ncbi:unnamed protein product [Amoebophrya sp. A120]|nr:unnamed protein product [Amoebophrya sp. A120]|eukprot:GSA120T00004794001.1